MESDLLQKHGEALLSYAPNIPNEGARDIFHTEVLTEVGQGLIAGHDKGFVKAPTRTGKTHMQAHMFNAALEVGQPKFLIPEPTKHLLRQNAGPFMRLNPDVKIGYYYGEEKDDPSEVDVLFTTYASLMLGIARGDIRPEDFTHVVYDEVHHLNSPQKKKAVGHFPNAIQVGFSATVSHGRNKHVRNVLPHEYHSSSIRESVEKNRLCSFSVGLVYTDTSLDEVGVIGFGDGKQYNQRQLEKAVNLARRTKAAVDLYKNAFDGEEIIVNCVGIDHARDVAQQFSEAGISAAAVWGSQNKKERKDIFERRARGEIKVLVNAKLLREGFDEPYTTAVFNLAPTLSPVIAEQRGRCLTINPNNPDKFAFVIDFIDKVTNIANRPISFAQIAEAAIIINNAAESKEHQKKNEKKFEYVSLPTEFKLLTKPEEVMWAVNSHYEIVESFIPSPHKTLIRTAAETGLSVPLLEHIAAKAKDIFGKKKYQDDVLLAVSPHGNNEAPLYPLRYIWSMLNEVLAVNGYAYTGDDNDPYVTRPDNPNQPKTSFMTRIAQMSKKADMTTLVEYQKRLLKELNSNPGLYFDK